jgi:vancomycin resistance protein YoaR
MNFTWILGLMILSQQMNIPGNLFITKNGQPVSTVNRSDLSMNVPGLPILNTVKFNQLMVEMDKNVSKDPKNAFIDRSGNIIREQVGYRLDRQKFTEQVYTYYFNSASSELEVPLQPIYPQVDSELLGTIRSEKIGEYVTSFSTHKKNRNNNIYRAAEAINNFVLYPGETFSFNKVVGERTAGKGYLPAPVIVKGKFAEDTGGGICQVSSTLYNAVDNAGLEVIKRYPHSSPISYVPPGRDATVSWNGPDFVFKNKYNQPILIQANTLGNQLIIEIYSSDVISFNPKNVPYLPYHHSRQPK